MSDKLYRGTITYTLEGVECQNVAYFLKDGGTATDLITALTNYWTTGIYNMLVSQLTFTHLKAIEVGHGIMDPDYYEQAISRAGNPALNHSDPQMPLCLNLHTGLSGKERRGRIFIGGIQDAGVEGGKLNTTGQTDANSVKNALVAAFTGDTPTSGWNLVVFSRKYFSLLSNPFESSYKKVTSIAVNTVLSTMRSRKPA